MILRRTMSALAAAAFVGALVAATSAEAQRSIGGSGARGGGAAMGGGFRGGSAGGFRGGSVGGFRGGMSGFRSGGVRAAPGGSFRGPRAGGFRGSIGRHAFVPRRSRFHHRRFHRRSAFAAVPFVFGAPYYAPYYYYDDPCWEVHDTPWGPRYVYICDPAY